MASKNFPSFHRRVSIPSLPIPIGMMGVRRSPGSVILVSLTLFCGVVFLLLRSGIGTALGPAWLSFLVYDDGYPRHNAEYATYVPRVGDPELQWRLRRLLDAPLQDYKTALVANEAPGACPRDIADRQAIRDQLRGQGSWWKTVRSSELAKRRMAMVKYLENIALSGGDVIGRPGGGRGIVMTGGNKDTTQRLLVTLRILRFEHRCKLPVEVFAFPGEIDDQDILFQMRALDATVRELPRQKLKKWKNFQIKADAIIASSFEEVLYLDSDNIPLRDPTYLFDSELYAGKGQPGAVFWPDITKDHGTNTIWRLMGKTCYHDDWELETG
ncbi:hypothetical protein DL93DRAFT_1116928 [Clavulina sp. PMI_390]|nr:hypothetical protein DL93DRAFT_1116928 [Clavulina sp. PMI_390]